MSKHTPEPMNESTQSQPKLEVTVHPFRKDTCYGNIIWAYRDRGSQYYPTSKFAMRNGKFPDDHPVSDESIEKFRSLGYWASCFPEGDGITFQPLNEQTDDQCLADIESAFGWNAKWA